MHSTTHVRELGEQRLVLRAELLLLRVQLLLERVVVLHEQLHLRRPLRLGDGPLRLAQLLLQHGAPRRRVSQGCKWGT